MKNSAIECAIIAEQEQGKEVKIIKLR